MSEVEKEKMIPREEEAVKCPNCGVILPEEIVFRLSRRNEKEFAFILVGVIMGAVIGVVGSFWVSFTIEILRSIIPETQWLLTSVLGLIVTTFVVVYVLVKMIRFAERHTGIESNRKEKKP